MTRRSVRAPKIRWRRPSLITVIMVVLTLAIWIGGGWALLHAYSGPAATGYSTTTR